MSENNKEIKFEAALKRLEEIVGKLEGGDLELEKSIELFEEGVRMAKTLQKKLDEAEKKIEKLVRGKDGALATEPAADPSEDAPF
ncbi:MAG: exodeoxyribonuclease VII small subunit [Nitrospinae bacterium]|nr:exodeoxyribonuclease VII small subunit [Nitrospinota bacterium]